MIPLCPWCVLPLKHANQSQCIEALQEQVRAGDQAKARVRELEGGYREIAANDRSSVDIVEFARVVGLVYRRLLPAPSVSAECSPSMLADRPCPSCNAPAGVLCARHRPSEAIPIPPTCVHCGGVPDCWVTLSPDHNACADVYACKRRQRPNEAPKISEIVALRTLADRVNRWFMFDNAANLQAMRLAHDNVPWQAVGACVCDPDETDLVDGCPVHDPRKRTDNPRPHDPQAEGHLLDHQDKMPPIIRDRRELFEWVSQLIHLVRESEGKRRACSETARSDDDEWQRGYREGYRIAKDLYETVGSCPEKHPASGAQCIYRRNYPHDQHRCHAGIHGFAVWAVPTGGTGT